MAPANLLPLPYFLPVPLLPRNVPNDGPDNGETEIPSFEPPPPPPSPYKYPGWGIAIGVLCVAITCLFFAFLCAGLNRRNNRRAALVAEFPCLDAKVPLASGLAGSTCLTAAALAMPMHAEAIGTLEMPEKEGVVRMPARVKRAWRRLGRRRTKEEDVEGVSVGVVELKPMGSGMKMEAKEQKEESRWVRDGEGVWVWERACVRGSEAAGLRRPSPVMLQECVERNDEDVIGFVTEEVLEDVDLK
jgi:hypothetical protein